MGGCASQSAMIQSALHALLPRLPPVLPPARETSRTMCANLNARCPSVHPAHPPLSHLVVICHHLPCRRGEGEGTQLKQSHPCKQGAKSAWQEQVCSKAEECEAGETVQDVEQGTGQPCPQVEKVNELGHPLCCRGDQEQVKGKAEDPILGRKTSLNTSSPLYIRHFYTDFTLLGRTLSIRTREMLFLLFP